MAMVKLIRLTSTKDDRKSATHFKVFSPSNCRGNEKGR